MPVHRLDVFRGECDEEKNGDKLDADHDAVRAGRLTNAQDEQDREQHDNKEADEIEMRGPACGRGIRGGT